MVHHKDLIKTPKQIICYINIQKMIMMINGFVFIKEKYKFEIQLARSQTHDSANSVLV